MLLSVICNLQVFGELTKGYETLDLFEKQPTKTEGIFVMPKVGSSVIRYCI
jgi:hypothetical protein